MIKIYDTTLRDGAQREGISLTLSDKLKIARKLDELGVHYIEGGFPGSNPKDKAFFDEIKKMDISASIVAFGNTRRKGIKAADDTGLRQLLDTEMEVVCIVGKCWDLHVTEAIKASLEENIKMIFESVEYLKKEGKEVIFDAEHFFDAFIANEDYAIQTLIAAESAGADWITLCDTNGGKLPFEVEEIVLRVTKKIKTPLGIHAHNDTECAVANSLMAVKAGVKQVQGTINGYGERCGNANLTSIIADLKLKMGYDCVSDESLGHLSEIAHYIAEIANLTPDSHQPYVGQSAFAHKGGLHADGVSKMSATYEHIEPTLVGNIQRVLVSELAGKGTIILKAKELGVDLSDSPDLVKKILTDIKELEHAGYNFEAAEGSFEILLQKELKTYKELFKLESFRVIMEKREDKSVVTEATVKILIEDQRLIATAEGNGPVNALDSALRKAIGKIFPALESIELTDFKVRVLNEKKGTGAVVRVLVESSDGEKSWGTVGLSENIIEASWQALLDSIDYGLTNRKDKA